MIGPAFWRQPEVRRLLERASRAAGMPVSIHYMDRGEESPRIFSQGQCNACAYLASHPEGVQACRGSRIPVSARALRRDRPVPFVCHMGFACISMRALRDEQYVLTFGPYSPSETEEALTEDAAAGLEVLDLPQEDVELLVLDIPRVPSGSVPEVALWTAEALREACTAWERDGDEGNSSNATAEDEAPRQRKRSGLVEDRTGAAIAACLSGGNLVKARELVQAALQETDSGKRAKLAVRRARVVSVAASTLEAAERAGMRTGDAWSHFGDTVRASQEARNDGQLWEAAKLTLGQLKSAKARPAYAQDMAELNALVKKHLEEGITLAEVAERLGCHPTAITHRLQRKFGMSYSEYVGRLRVDKAKELLRRTELRISEVARRVGINDVSNLAKQFRKFEGMPPAEYRKRYAE